MRIILIFAILVFSLEVLAAQPAVKKSKKKTTYTKPITSDPGPDENLVSRSKMGDLLAIPVGGIIGFGLGHGLQSRYSTRGWIYSVTDGAAMLYFVATTFGSCNPSDQSCKDDQDRNRKIGIPILLASRIIQVIDLTYFFSEQKYASKKLENSVRFAIVPDLDGSIQSNLTWSF